MNHNHRETRLLLGAYILGGLDPSDRARVEAHLPDCAGCRDELSRAAALPGLLRRADALPDPEPAPEPSVAETLQPRLIAQLRSQRKRRRRRSLGVLLAAAVLAVALALTPQLLRPPAAEVAAVLVLHPATGTGSGEAALTARPWGTSLALTAAQLPTHGPFTLEVTSRSGTAERAATWGTTSDGHVQVTGATSLQPGDIDRVQVRGPAGVLLQSS